MMKDQNPEISLMPEFDSEEAFSAYLTKQRRSCRTNLSANGTPKCKTKVPTWPKFCHPNL